MTIVQVFALWLCGWFTIAAYGFIEIYTKCANIRWWLLGGWLLGTMNGYTYYLFM